MTLLCDLCGQYVVRSLSSLLLSLLLLSGSALGAVDFERQTITIAIPQEPPSLNSTQMTDLMSYFVLGHISEGLLGYDKRGRLAPGVASSWVQESNRITFQLRKDARWADGSSVTAHDFVYAWRLMNDPAQAAPFAAIMYPIKNAESVQGGLLPVDQLGVRAVSDFELVMDLERPCGYCLSLMPHGSFFPINEAFHKSKGQLYGSEAAHLLTNGPFSLTSWVHESSLTFTKNPSYWNKDAILLNEIRVAYVTSDNRARLNLFRDGQIAYARLGAETVKDSLDQGLKLKTFLSGGVSYIWFNMDGARPTRSRPLRQAIQAAFDPDQFVNKIIAIPGYKPTTTLFPSWFNGLEAKFVNEYPPKPVIRDKNRARQLLNEADKELGGIPALTLLTVSSPTGGKVAEYFQGMLKQTLNIDAKVDQQTFKQYLVKARRGEFDLVFSSWYPDFDDLVTYADLLGSYNPNNRGKFINPEYDRWLKVLQTSISPGDRFDAAGEMQRIIIDEVPILPMAETGSAYLQHPKLRGVVRRVIGQDPDFTRAWVVQ